MNHPLWDRGFRPFFLLASAHAVLGALWWSSSLLGWLPAPRWLIPQWWHGHEMVFGFAAAVIAGFLLTAVPNWTGARPVAGARLAGLAGLWLAGRFAMILSGALPLWLVAVVDLAFLPALAAMLVPPLWAARRVRNYGFVPLLLILATANAVMHAEAMGVGGGRAILALRFAVDLMIVLIVVMTARITPMFTRNGLMRRGLRVDAHSIVWLDRLAVAGVVGLAVADVLAPRTVWSGTAALVGAVAAAARTCGWYGWRTLRDPLLWSLHLGSVWVSVGLLLVALGDLTSVVPMGSGLHSLTAGAIGATVIAMITRVALGHTGRPLVAPRPAVAAYVLVSLGALVRVTAPIVLPAPATEAIVLGGVLWSVGFGLYVVSYAPLLLGPEGV